MLAIFCTISVDFTFENVFYYIPILFMNFIERAVRFKKYKCKIQKSSLIYRAF